MKALGWPSSTGQPSCTHGWGFCDILNQGLFLMHTASIWLGLAEGNPFCGRSFTHRILIALLLGTVTNSLLDLCWLCAGHRSSELSVKPGGRTILTPQSTGIGQASRRSHSPTLGTEPELHPPPQPMIFVVWTHCSAAQGTSLGLGFKFCSLACLASIMLEETSVSARWLPGHMKQHGPSCPGGPDVG